MEHPVSFHAAARYLERVHGMTHLAAYGRSDRDRVEMGAERLGLTVDEVRDLVLPPRLHAAVAMGLKGYVKAGDRTLPIRNGSVVTCLEPEPNPRKARQRRIAA